MKNVETRRTKIHIFLDSNPVLILKEGEHNNYFREDEMADIKRLYFMYEFSDRIRLLEESIQYGGLSNYVKLGILTEDEAEKAALMQEE